MIAILGGLGAAVAWAISTLCSSRSSRLIEPRSVVAWVMLAGLVVAAPLAAASGVPSRLGGMPGVWLIVSGAGNVGGLLLAYAALRIGQIALVAPLVSTEGAMAAVIALLAGESLAPGVGAMLAVIVVGICLASIPGDGEGGAALEGGGGAGAGGLESGGGAGAGGLESGGGAGAGHGRAESRAHHGRTALLALAAASTFGVSLYATGRAGSTLPASWVVLSARLIGTIVIALPLALSGRLRLIRAAAPLVVTSGICEVLGFYSYTTGARHGIAIAAVLSSQFGALAGVAGYHLFGDRLSRVQTTGLAAVVLGVAVLTGLRA